METMVFGEPQARRPASKPWMRRLLRSVDPISPPAVVAMDDGYWRRNSALTCGREASHGRCNGQPYICCIKSVMRSLAGSLVLLAAAPAALVAQPAPGAVDADFFETKIRPLFADNSLLVDLLNASQDSTVGSRT